MCVCVCLFVCVWVWLGSSLSFKHVLYILPSYLDPKPGSVQVSVLIQDIEQVCGMFSFIIRRDWEGSDVSRFSLANTILKTH